MIYFVNGVPVMVQQKKRYSLRDYAEDCEYEDITEDEEMTPETED